MRQRTRYLALFAGLSVVAPVMAGLGGASVQVGARFEWEVVNRFPVFTNADHFARIAGISTDRLNRAGTRLWAVSGKAEDTVNSPGFTARLREMLPATEETAWNPATGLYDRDVLFRSDNAIVVRSDHSGDRCTWRLVNLEGTSVPEQRVGSCTGPHEFGVDINKRYRLELELPGISEIIEAQVEIRKRLIVVIGDSFASGEGNPDHPAILVPRVSVDADWMHLSVESTNLRIREGAKWWDQACHRSLLSWPALVALKRAVESPHEVVRFASFACSGAQTFDGILDAQINPPGGAYATQGLEDMFDYKYGYTGDRVLRHSQVSALAHLVCDQVAFRSRAATRASPELTSFRQRPFFGSVSLPECVGGYQQVDDLLLMVGGNDAGFSGVVRWTLNPQKLKYRTILGLYQLVANAAIQSAIEPIDPYQTVDARESIPALYNEIRHALSLLRIQEARTQLGLYPDVAKGLEKESNAALQDCNRRTADGFMPMQTLLAHVPGVRHASARFGARLEALRTLSPVYIAPLRRAQMAGLGAWTSVDTDRVFEGRGLCATGCDGQNCSNGDRVRWKWRPADTPWDPAKCSRIRGEDQQVVYSCDTPPLEDVAHFDPYAADRSRGLRFATDAYLTAATLQFGRGPRFQEDAIFGAVHPTANIHAAIADIVALSK